MHLVENKTATFIFLTKFCKPSHVYPINSANNLLVPTLKLKKVSIEFLLEAFILEQHFDSSRKNPRKSSKISGLLEIKNPGS